MPPSPPPSPSVAGPAGLSEEEARRRLAQEGANELPRGQRRTVLRIMGEVLREPMLLMLLIGVLLYFLLGDMQDALILAVFASFSVLITTVQEARTESVLESLQDLASPRALVIRDGARRRIAGREVVRGDLLLVEEGDRVPADARILESRGLKTDESLLTGESVPVDKVTGGSERTGHVYSGTLAVRGSALCEVTRIGAESAIGRISHVLGGIEAEPPRLRVQTQRIVRAMALVGTAVTLMAVLLYGLLRGDWLQAALNGIAIGMSMLPEELPVVMMVFMAVGAWRISRLRVLTRRAAMIEMLGAATVLCTDKTGTLTENRMVIAELRLADGRIFQPHREAAMPSAFARIGHVGALASEPQPFDPMDKAFHALGESHGQKDAQPEDGYRLRHRYPLDPALLAVSHVWGGPEDAGPATVAAKGAPEAIAGLCRLDEGGRAAIKQAADAMAAEGLRVLALAEAAWDGADLPDSPHGFAFTFLGLAGIADPLRANVPAALDQCRTAGVRVKMITGDYPVTARAIARQAGIDASDVLTGAELEEMDDAALAARVRDCAVYARIMPEQKLRIVEALKQNGEIVAMTGDGVNDAPSLKAAHIGIAMGGRGTDVAREASSMVLLDDDFSSIVATIRMGRRIYDNLRKAMGFIIAVHVPIAGLALMPLLLGYPILFAPIHIAFLEMIIDPVCSLVFEAEEEEADIMERAPRPPEAPLFTSGLLLWALVQGGLALLLTGVIALVGFDGGLPVDNVRSLTFFALVAVIFGLILINRSFGARRHGALFSNRALVYVLAAVTAILALAQFWPWMGTLFAFAPLHWADLALALAAGLFLRLALEPLRRALHDRLTGQRRAEA